MISRAVAGPIMSWKANENADGADVPVGVDSASVGARSTGTRWPSTRPFPVAGKGSVVSNPSSHVGNSERGTAAVAAHDPIPTVSQEELSNSSVPPAPVPASGRQPGRRDGPEAGVWDRIRRARRSGVEALAPPATLRRHKGKGVHLLSSRHRPWPSRRSPPLSISLRPVAAGALLAPVSETRGPALSRAHHRQLARRRPPEWAFSAAITRPVNWPRVCRLARVPTLPSAPPPCDRTPVPWHPPGPASRQ